MVFEPLATAEAVLTHDERELGVLLLDIGVGTTEYASSPRARCSTAASADGRRALHQRSRDGAAHPVRRGRAHQGAARLLSAGMVGEDEGDLGADRRRRPARVVPTRELCEILQPRAEELLTLLRDDLVNNGFDESLRGGVVLTGGGAQLDGLLEMAEQVFNTGVATACRRVWAAWSMSSARPTWCTASGLLLYARRRTQPEREGEEAMSACEAMIGNLRGDVLGSCCKRTLKEGQK